MDYLFNNWEYITRHFENRNIFLFLDYDGTIAPIVEYPEKAFIPENIRATLNQLLQYREIRIAIISGRSLKDIKNRVSMDGIIYSGNHGFEIEGAGFHYEYEVPNLYRRELDNIKKELTNALSGFAGVLIEDKGLTLSIHYRLADESIVPELHSILAQYYGNKFVQVREEKKTFEIVPLLAWNKGNAVLSILNDSTPVSGKEWFPIFLGDTLTDENVFIALQDIGLTIRVGFDKYSSAQYYLNDVSDVYQLLNKLASRRDPYAVNHILRLT